MKASRTFISFLVFVICFSFTGQITIALPTRAPDAVIFTLSLAAEVQMLQPSGLFREFPEIKWGMSFQDAKKAIEKTGARPVGFRDAETELAWDGTFNGMAGRGTVLFKEGAGVYEIAVIVHAMDKRNDVFKTWRKKLVEKHGAARKKEDNSIHTSELWRLKNGFAIELRLLKDDDSPVVDIHWVKE